MNKELKHFKVFCHLDEENNPIIHEITMDKKGSVRLHSHPELQSEVYYTLLMVQKEKGEGKVRNYNYRGDREFPVKGCLQFYFSLIHRKFEQYIDDITFVTKNNDHPQFIRCDNDRLEDYLELIKRKTKNRERFNREDVWSEKAFYEANQRKLLTARDNIFKRQFMNGIERIERYGVNLDFIFKNKIDTDRKRRGAVSTQKYYFSSGISSRASRTRGNWRHNSIRRDGFISVTVELTKDWFKDVNKAGIAVIDSKNHGKLITLAAEPIKGGYLIDAVVPNKGTQKKYIIQKYKITKNVVTGEWEAHRKNRTSPPEITPATPLLQKV